VVCNRLIIVVEREIFQDRGDVTMHPGAGDLTISVIGNGAGGIIWG
jgi:hypothetical protein